MDRTLKEHITRLEERLRTLHEQSMDDHHSYPERNQIESEIRAAKMALEYYRKAYELERQMFPRG